RHFVFVDNRYLFVADTVQPRGGGARTFTWLLHGNGGGTSGGAFEVTSTGGRWTHGAARLDSAIAFDVAPPAVDTGTRTHQAPGPVVLRHSVLRASAAAVSVHSAQLVYPSRTGDAAPVASAVAITGSAGVVLADPDGDRRVLAFHRAKASSLLAVPSSDS